MTAILALVQRDDFTTDVDSLNLLDFSSGWALADDGWQQAVAGAGDVSVVETLTLIVRGATHDALAAAVQALDLKLTQVARYADNPTELSGVWLRVRMANETGTRQALLLTAKRGAVRLWAGEVKNSSGGYFYTESYTLALERAPYWEADAHVVYGAAPAVNCVGGMFDYTTYGGTPGIVKGDAPARLAFTTLAGYAGGGGPLTKFWCGFRSNRFGNRANFQPTWSLRKGAAFDSVTTGGTGHADASAKDGYKTITTYSGPTTPMARRVTIRVQDVTANTSDQRGTFLVLLRAKLNAAGVIDARLAQGLYSAPSLWTQERVPISGTGWQLYEMGTVQIPSPGRQIGGVWAIDSYALAIDAEWISGTAELHMDCLILIPVTEGWFSVDLGAPAGADGVQTGKAVMVVDRPDGIQKYALFESGSTPLSAGALRLTDGMPVGMGIFVLAGQQLAVSVLADAVNVTMQVYPRWETLRGAS